MPSRTFAHMTSTYQTLHFPCGRLTRIKASRYNWTFDGLYPAKTGVLDHLMEITIFLRRIAILTFSPLSIIVSRNSSSLLATYLHVTGNTDTQDNKYGQKPLVWNSPNGCVDFEIYGDSEDWECGLGHLPLQCLGPPNNGIQLP
jgi:hypothetical protein